MKNKVLKILDIILFIASWFFLGMGASLGIHYGNYNMFYYIGAGVLCFILSCVCTAIRKDDE